MKQSDGGERKAALHLVDLAGSEGVRRTSHSGIALKEGNHINQGLLCIAKVVKALSTKAKVIPYRDTILTTALQDSLNLNSYLTMLACISPYQRDFNETMSTLRFLRNAKVIKINPQINSVINEYKVSKTIFASKLSSINSLPLFSPTESENSNQTEASGNAFKYDQNNNGEKIIWITIFTTPAVIVLPKFNGKTSIGFTSTITKSCNQFVPRT